MVGVRWVKTYGPTEASVIATARGRQGPGEVNEVDPPIGRPIARRPHLHLSIEPSSPSRSGSPGHFIGGRPGPRVPLNLPRPDGLNGSTAYLSSDRPDARLHRTGCRADGDLTD